MIPTDWTTIFSLSVVNGAEYHGDTLPVMGREWPQRTWLQTRLEEVRKERRSDEPQPQTER